MFFNNLKLRSKIILPVSVILVVLITAIIVFVLIQVQSITNHANDERLKGMVGAAVSKLNDFEEKTRLTAMAVAGNFEVVSSIIEWNNEADRQGARTNMVAFLQESAAEFGVDSFIVRDFEGRVIVRLHALDQYDDLDGSPSGIAALEGRTTTAYSSTGTMPMGMSTTVPIRHGGEIIGTLAPLVFLHTNAFVDEFADIFNAEVTVFGGEGARTRVATTLIQDGQRIVGTRMDNELILSTVVDQGNTYTGELELLGVPHSTIYHPLTGAGGNVVGMLFFGFSNEAIISQTNTTITILIIIGVIGLAVAIFIVLLVANRISRPLIPLAAFMETAGNTGNLALRDEDVATIAKYAEMKDEIGRTIKGASTFVGHVANISGELEVVSGGDLSVDIHVLSDKDTMGMALKNLLSNLNSMFTEINQASGQVSGGSKQISDGAQTLAQGSTEQAASVEQLSSSISEIAQKTKDNAEMAGRAASLATNIKSSAEKGSSQMNEMMIAVKDINESSQNISKVIKSIDDIAFQTNILALNAAVEAARAGQHGKGFAVVAAEVRNLAAKSAEAAKDTESLIADSISKAELGSRIAGGTSESLRMIVDGIDESTKLVSDIAKSSDEQSVGIDKINKGVDQVATVTQQNSATAEQSAAASQEMSGQSLMLEELISRFKLKRGASHSLSPGQNAPKASLPEAKQT
ncbi:MAG: methyl-accepting chemotaxis protein [Oscillospiraceae bacterium]|nr:methyl-accepting chemotaxis protein [Oscillospiraceae bacterium]MCL2280216.1 methyl-accepting chemotaxis protein [Oscillospiraceae bacterium]